MSHESQRFEPQRTDRIAAPSAMHLTPREVQVLKLIASGCAYKRVADRLGISLNTVTSHIKNIYRKLDTHTAAASVMRAIELQQFANPGGH